MSHPISNHNKECGKDYFILSSFGRFVCVLTVTLTIFITVCKAGSLSHRVFCRVWLRTALPAFFRQASPVSQQRRDSSPLSSSSASPGAAQSGVWLWAEPPLCYWLTCCPLESDLSSLCFIYLDGKMRRAIIIVAASSGPNGDEWYIIYSECWEGL